MLKGILKYSMLTLFVIMAGLYPSLATFNKYTILLLIIPIAILAIGSVRFYRKRNTDNKRLLKSVIFFIASSLLTCGLFFLGSFGIIFLIIAISRDGLVLVAPVLVVVLTYAISKFKRFEHIRRNPVVALAFVVNFTIIYFLNVDAVDRRFGIQNSFDIFDETTEVSTPYGKFFSYSNKFEHYENDKCWYHIDSIAAYDQYVVLTADSSYLFIDQQANVTEVSSFANLPVDVRQEDFVEASKYIEDLYWQIHNDNYLYVIKTLIALVLSTIVTVVEYFVLKKIWPRMREFVS
ncbi:MAG: hypothetical protein J6Y22_10240 [Paludibacteraceae bacterium]|nr:hypothetical protein [Paludibacteraceae bacterium]